MAVEFHPCLLNSLADLYVTLGHKTGHKCQFFKIEIYASSGSWINNLSIGQYLTTTIWDTTIWKSGIWGSKKYLNIEKIYFKVVQMKFLALHVTNQKMKFWYIYSKKLGYDLNILMIFGIIEKLIILTHTVYCWLLLQLYLCCLWLLLCSRVTNCK